MALPFVLQEQWDGLPVALILTTFGVVLSFPLGSSSLGCHSSGGMTIPSAKCHA